MIMAFRNDKRMTSHAPPTLGQYVVTFDSANEQVRADLFKRGDRVTAYVSFPSGLSASQATDSYYDELVNYAREEGFRDAFRVVYASGS
jgi:hypothetical protein